jgi:hypothetical protein
VSVAESATLCLRAAALLAVHAVLGASVLRGAGAHPSRAVGRLGVAAVGALLALEAVFLAVLGLVPLLVFIAVLAGIALGQRTWARSPSVALARPRRRPAVVVAFALACVALAVAFVALRPPVPLYWDEFIWLGKARLVAQGAGTLRDATLDARVVVPAGYPLFWPIAVGWLAAHRTDAATLVVAARTLVATTAVIYLGALGARARHRGWVFATAAVGVVAAPFVFVHLRSVYVDLPVGLLTAALGALLVVPASRSSALVVAVVAAALASAKDEGFVHVAVVASIATIPALRARDASRLLSPLAAWLGAAVPFLAWRVLLVEHGATDPDHGLGLPDVTTVLPLLRIFASHALDVQSWGLFWPIVAGVALSEATRRDARGAAARLFASMLACDVAAVFVGLTACPERVHEFAEGGTLVGRLLLQEVPLAIVMVAEVVDVRVALSRGRARERVLVDRPAA